MNSNKTQTIILSESENSDVEEYLFFMRNHEVIVPDEDKHYVIAQEALEEDNDFSNQSNKFDESSHDLNGTSHNCIKKDSDCWSS